MKTLFFDNISMISAFAWIYRTTPRHWFSNGFCIVVINCHDQYLQANTESSWNGGKWIHLNRCINSTREKKNEHESEQIKRMEEWNDTMHTLHSQKSIEIRVFRANTFVQCHLVLYFSVCRLIFNLFLIHKIKAQNGIEQWEGAKAESERARYG